MSQPVYEVDWQDLRAKIAQLNKQLGMVPDEFKKELRRTLRDAAGNVLSQARSNASFSTRIPAALSIRTQLGLSTRPRVIITALNSDPTDHARPIEGMLALSDYFRHPVFADESTQTRKEWTWVPQLTHPYLVPAMESEQAPTIDLMADAIEKVLRRSGLQF